MCAAWDAGYSAFACGLISIGVAPTSVSTLFRYSSYLGQGEVAECLEVLASP